MQMQETEICVAHLRFIIMWHGDVSWLLHQTNYGVSICANQSKLTGYRTLCIDETMSLINKFDKNVILAEAGIIPQIQSSVDYRIIVIGNFTNNYLVSTANIQSSCIQLYVRLSSSRVVIILLHHGCSSGLLGPIPPRFTTLFPVLSYRTLDCSYWETHRNKGLSGIMINPKINLGLTRGGWRLHKT